MCAGHAILPSSLHFELPEFMADPPYAHGGFADVWRCESHGRYVAVKALRIYPIRNVAEVTRVSQHRRISLPIRIGELSVHLRGSTEKSSLGSLSGIQTCCRW